MNKIEKRRNKLQKQGHRGHEYVAGEWTWLSWPGMPHLKRGAQVRSWTELSKAELQDALQSAEEAREQALREIWEEIQSINIDLQEICRHGNKRSLIKRFEQALGWRMLIETCASWPGEQRILAWHPLALYPGGPREKLPDTRWLSDPLKWLLAVPLEESWAADMHQNLSTHARLLDSQTPGRRLSEEEVFHHGTSRGYLHDFNEVSKNLSVSERHKWRYGKVRWQQSWLKQKHAEIWGKDGSKLVAQVRRAEHPDGLRTTQGRMVMSLITLADQALSEFPAQEALDALLETKTPQRALALLTPGLTAGSREKLVKGLRQGKDGLTVRANALATTGLWQLRLPEAQASAWAILIAGDNNGENILDLEAWCDQPAWSLFPKSLNKNISDEQIYDIREALEHALDLPLNLLDLAQHWLKPETQREENEGIINRLPLPSLSGILTPQGHLRLGKWGKNTEDDQQITEKRWQLELPGLNHCWEILTRIREERSALSSALIKEASQFAGLPEDHALGEGHFPVLESEAAWHMEFDWQGHCWHFSSARTPGTLEHDGSVLRHCVGGYSQQCRQGTRIIRLLKDKELIINIEITQGEVIQAKGKHNREPDTLEQEVIEIWIKAAGLKNERRKKHQQHKQGPRKTDKAPRPEIRKVEIQETTPDDPRITQAKEYLEEKISRLWQEEKHHRHSLDLLEALINNYRARWKAILEQHAKLGAPELLLPMNKWALPSEWVLNDQGPKEGPEVTLLRPHQAGWEEERAKHLQSPGNPRKEKQKSKNGKTPESRKDQMIIVQREVRSIKEKLEKEPLDFSCFTKKEPKKSRPVEHLRGEVITSSLLLYQENGTQEMQERVHGSSHQRSKLHLHLERWQQLLQNMQVRPDQPELEKDRQEALALLQFEKPQKT